MTETTRRGVNLILEGGGFMPMNPQEERLLDLNYPASISGCDFINFAYIIADRRFKMSLCQSLNLEYFQKKASEITGCQLSDNLLLSESQDRFTIGIPL